MKKITILVFLLCSVAFGVKIRLYDNTDTYKYDNIEVSVEQIEDKINFEIKDNGALILQGKAVYDAKNDSYLYKDKRCSFEIELREIRGVCRDAISNELSQGYDPTKILAIGNI